jgi:glycosyltransferase involved in cell wall biosynthesis
MQEIPFISVIVPCYNEQATIRILLDSIYRQTYPLERRELVLADGMSTDLTRDEVTAFLRNHPDFKVKVIDNIQRDIPSGLNKAIAEASGKFIVRSDAHSAPYPDYIERNVAALLKGKGEVVGGVWEVKPGADHWIARAIATAGAHPLGVGDALYRYTTQAQYVDTVPFGAFRKDLLNYLSIENGPYDETLLTNEDYEFYVRVRKSGGRIWLDPTIRSVYFARKNLVDLAKQYWRYGYWKLKMLMQYPQTIRWRQALPPLFVLNVLGLGILGLFIPVLSWLMLIEVVMYLSILFVAGVIRAFKQGDTGMIFGLPLAIVTMHLCWGMAFLWSFTQEKMQLGRK